MSSKVKVRGDAPREFVKTFDRLCGAQSRWNIWSDFLHLSAYTISNAVDMVHREKREKDYMTIRKGYTEQEMLAFSELFAITVMALEDDPKPLIDSLQDEDVVMQNAYGNPLTTRGFAEELIKYGKKYGVPRNVLHAHAFRHFFAIEFLKRNNNIALLADLLGHGSVNVTQIYLRMSQEQQKDAIDKAVDW